MKRNSPKCEKKQNVKPKIFFFLTENRCPYILLSCYTGIGCFTQITQSMLVEKLYYLTCSGISRLKLNDIKIGLIDRGARCLVQNESQLFVSISTVRPV